AGTKVYVAEEGMGTDETHYFLIPFRAADRGYAIGTQRVLPEGIGPENDLPTRRVFHLPRHTEIETLERFLADDLADGHAAAADPKSDLAERLDSVADEIDRKSNVVTGGLLLIGGAVAFANPVVGAGIAAKALIPGVGAALSREGLKKAGEILRRRHAEDVEDKAGRMAERQVKRMNPEVHENALLSLLEEAVSSSDPSFDPMMHDLVTGDDVGSIRVVSITAESVLNTYRDVLAGGPDVLAEAHLDSPDTRWLESLRDFVTGRNQARSG
ncbi:MAG: hypothetical protein ACR2RV_04495, partial [Verrucomicrobiales bacterium]